MGKRVIYKVSVLFFMFLVFSNVYAKKSDLPRYIREKLHNDVTYTIITERNLENIDNIITRAGKKHFLVVQPRPQTFKKEQADKILGWVKNGGVVWYYDSRLASLFGMKNSPLKKGKFRGKEYKGGFGTGKVPGVNVIAQVYPFVEHPVSTGVQSIQAFLMEIDEELYSAVDEKTPGIIPIFRVNIEPKAVVAARKHGKGWIIFKPLLWPDVLGGERFQVNLMEFSGGYPVPRGVNPVIPLDALKGKPVKLSRYDSLILTDGQQVIGMLKDKKINFLGADEKLTKKISQVKSIEISPTGSKIILRDGKEYSGVLLNMYVNFKTITGKTVKLDKSNVMKINLDIAHKK